MENIDNSFSLFRPSYDAHNKGVTFMSDVFDDPNESGFIKKTLKIPKRIILVRHGESLGNVDESVYCTTPDWKVPLTETGKSQATSSGKRIKDMIFEEPICIYCSPYLRTKETLMQILSQLKTNQIISAREEPRLTEQQFGNFQNHEDMCKFKACRHDFGRFYYRFPEGESGLDVYDRVSLFIGTLWRDWDHIQDIENSNVLIVTHGITLRMFLMRWYQYTVDEFEQTKNPSNGAIVVMERHPRNLHLQQSNLKKDINEIYQPYNRGDRTIFTLEVEYRMLLGLSTSYDANRKEKDHTHTIQMNLDSINETNSNEEFMKEEEEEKVEKIELMRKPSVKLYNRSPSDVLDIISRSSTSHGLDSPRKLE